MTVAPTQSPAKQTIALVDDDRNILTSVQMTLEQEGFAVRTYTDGESALQGLSSRPVDLAVLDVKMPRMDGMELLQRLRQRSTMPVIFLTSLNDQIYEEAALQARLSNTPSQAPTGEQAGTALPAAARAPQPGDDLSALQRQREATLGPEAAARLQALDQAQATWAENIQATRRALTRLQGAAELSALQRQQAIDQLIESHFAPEDRLRARAVLGLISP